MNLTKEVVQDHLVIYTEGRLDTTQADNFEKQVTEMLKDDHKKVILDCKGLNYISSSGLRVFLILQKKMVAGSGSLKICNLQPSIREIFDMSGFSMIFSIYDDLEAALKA